MTVIVDVLREVAEEWERACASHLPMNGPHEGKAVIEEELDELWALVKADRGRSERARWEAVQIAAMACRYVLDVCAPNPRPSSPARQALTPEPATRSSGATELER